MRLFRTLADGIWALFHKPQADRELDEELRSYVEMSAQEKMRSGMAPERAMRSARVEMGSPEAVKEHVRGVGWETMLETIWQDIRYGLRMLRKTPAITAVALLSLALGIGANTAIFSLIDTVMLRMLPVQKPVELVKVGMRAPQWGDRILSSFTNPLWEQLREHQDVFTGVIAWSMQSPDLADGGESQPIPGIFASGDYFNTLGVRPMRGRLFSTADDYRGCSGAVVLGYGFWQEHFGGAEDVIGSTLRLNGHPFPVIGVTPPGFFGVDVGYNFDVAIPICAEAIFSGKDSMLDERGAWWLRVMGRLKPGVSAEQATVRLNALSSQILAAAVPSHWPPKAQQNFLKRTLAAELAKTGMSELRSQYTRPLEILMVVVGLVLLIACANIASLMLARSAARQKEIAVRLSLGASRARLIRQVLTESIVLSGAGALLGILFARWGGALLVSFVSTSHEKVFLDLPMDSRVLGFTAGIAVLTGLLFGILPAFRATRVSLTSAMKGGQVQDLPDRSRFRSGRWIVAMQVSFSLLLLVGTGLFARTFRNLLTLNPGFDRNNVLLVTMNVHKVNVAPKARASFYTQVLGRLTSIPGAVSVSQTWFTPISGMEWNQEIEVEGYQPPSGEEPLVYFNWVTPGYFATLRNPLLSGRNFDGRDAATSPPVAIVNQTMARQYFPNANPIGKYFHIADSHIASSKPIQIVGIVADSKYDSLREPFLPFAYVPLVQVGQEGSVSENSSFEIRTAVTPASLIPAVRDAIGGVNKAASLEFRTLAQQVDDSLTQERLLAVLSGFFGLLALLLTAIGLYGVMAYLVTQRTHEIGIRMALGAQPRSILRFVMSDAVILLVAGTAAGLLGAFWLTRLAQQLLFGLTANDPLTMVIAALALASVALLASYLPARRAMRVDPMVALRYE